MFYSSIAQLDAVRKVDSLNLDNYHVVPVSPGIAACFEVVNDQSDELGKIIAAAEKISNPLAFPVCHMELRIDDDAEFGVIARAELEKELGKPYSYEGALRAWNDSGWHKDGEWWCDAVGGYGLQFTDPMFSGLNIWVNPSTMLRQLIGILRLPMPKFAAPAGVEIGEKELVWLDDLTPEQCSTGTKQEMREMLT